MGERVDYTGTATAYRQARTLPPAALDAWTAAVTALDLPIDGVVLDLGAGPGGFLGPLAEWFGASVVALEPSVAMRIESDASVPYVAAVAERLPLADGCASVAWLSTVVHQFDDLGAAAAELHRVLRPGGHVLVRGFFADQAMTGVFGLFPGIERSAARFPSTGAATAAFGAAGFERPAVVDVVEPWRFELDAWTERVASIRHTDSALRPLTDDEFAAGVAAVRAAHPQGGTIESDLTLRLLVLRRR